MKKLFRRIYARLLLYRKSIAATNVSRLSEWLVIVIFFLASSFVFTLPSPIRPRTSIGLIIVCVLALLAIVAIKRKKEAFAYSRILGLPDFILMGFLIINLFSMLMAQRITQPENIRLIFSATVFYILLRILPFSTDLKDRFITVLSHMCIFFSALTLSQLILPSLFNSIATNYFAGREAYGLTVEFNRGRLFPWGATIFLSPFFFVHGFSEFLKKTRLTNIYFLGGLGVITMSLIASNFRWTFIVYAVVSFWILMWQKAYIRATRRQLYTVLVGMLCVISIGLIASNQVFGYNLLDRFLLKQHERDVGESLGRFTLYDQGINVFLSSPVLGVGPGNYYDMVDPFIIMRYFSVHDQYEQLPVPIASHNEFLTALSEGGVFSFLFFTLFIYLIFRRLYEVYVFRHALSRTDSKLLTALLGTFVSFMLYTMFENILPQNYVLLFGLAAIVFTWFPNSLSERDLGV